MKCIKPMVISHLLKTTIDKPKIYICLLLDDQFNTMKTAKFMIMIVSRSLGAQ